MPGGDKSKARAILAAIRSVKRIEQEQRTATDSERQVLAQFSGFGPVALSLFPDPVTGRYKDDSWKALGTDLELLLTVRETTRVPLGTYRGLSFGLVIYPVGVTAVYLEGAATRQTDLSQENHGPRAVLNAAERLITGYGPEAERIGEDLTIAESQLRDYQARFGAPFVHDGYLAELTGLRDELKAGLSGKMPEPGSQPTSVAEVAGRIKTLKASHSIDPTPQRTRQKQVTAEEPVTARIRRRIESITISKPATQPDMQPTESTPAQSNGEHIGRSDVPPPLPPGDLSPSLHGDHKPHLTFQQRLAMERRCQDPNPSLP